MIKRMKESVHHLVDEVALAGEGDGAGHLARGDHLFVREYEFSWT